jgi:hypothetical protein
MLHKGGGRVSASHKHWFRRGRGGLGHFPQTWQGWVSLAAFLVVLSGTVLVIGGFWGDHPQAQAVTFVVAAFEIMGFLRFVRAHSESRD